MMEQKIIEDFKKLVAGFRALTTKVQNSSHNKTKNWKDTNLELEACKRVSELVSWVQKFEKLKMDEFFENGWLWKIFQNWKSIL